MQLFDVYIIRILTDCYQISIFPQTVLNQFQDRNFIVNYMNMVVVTHEMGFARSVADRIIFMAEGQILVDTTDVDGFFDNPTEPRAVQFLSKIIDHNSDRVQVDA